MRKAPTEAQLLLRPQPSIEARERHFGELRHEAEALLARGVSVSLRAGPEGELEVIPPGTGEAQRQRIVRFLAREEAPSEARLEGTEAPLELSPAPHRSVPPLVRWQRLFLWGLVLLSVASVAVSNELPWQALVAFGLIAAYAVTTRERASDGFAQAVNALTLVGLIALLAVAFTKAQTFQVSAAEGALLLAANRLLVRRTPEDDGLLHLTTFLLLAAGAALGGDLLYGLLLTGFACSPRRRSRSPSCAAASRSKPPPGPRRSCRPPSSPPPGCSSIPRPWVAPRCSSDGGVPPLSASPAGPDEGLLQRWTPHHGGQAIAWTSPPAARSTGTRTSCCGWRCARAIPRPCTIFVPSPSMPSPAPAGDARRTKRAGPVTPGPPPRPRSRVRSSCS